MKNDIESLKEEFLRIKNMGLIKSLRNGTTGIGYTFESLLNKREDQNCKPDFKSIELKCKLGYSKSPLTLFSYSPKRNNQPALNYIFEKYNHHLYNNPNNYRIFSLKAFSNYTYKINEYEFKLKVDYLNKEILLQSFFKDLYLEDVCSWDFKTLENKLKIKLNTMALIYGYPYYRNKETYYKYFTMKLYKLKGFFEFLKLIEEDKIFIQFNLKEKIDKNGNTSVENHGVCFKMRKEYIPKLFYSIKY